MAARRKQHPVIIETALDVRRGVMVLRRKCPHMRRLHDLTGDPPLRRYAAGFEGLSRIVVGQQLSTASAGAIWTRTAAAVQPFSPRVMLMRSDTELRAAGLSRAKIKTLRAVAAAIDGNELDLAGLSIAGDEVVRGALTSVSGIGPWTADIYLMFCLGRADSWASGDLALQVAVQSALAMGEKPTARDLEDIAERWRPWRSIAARLLWAYYATLKTGPAVAGGRNVKKPKKAAQSAR